ncbi:EamA family transporter [Erythrobacter arachoides]|uniref:EamA family transporter n=1 Tax=Aurantiacibacter arachoides TaxID=1850444 RepID=A0A845A498_9SPHN|nr:DMT family transporter [Aurantiacibacter arachoides]MXO94728.1 EamA family transporter [Aurantiacibacter arachoides]GGD61113.1 membrane protein [Aurantiacibacter arachoides]
MSDIPAAHRPHALLRPAIALPFLLIALIWGSTWFVITTQIAQAPTLWSVTYRFAIAAPTMFALALVTRQSLAMPRATHLLALAMGLFQFVGNFVFVYMAELHLTSGIVALLIGLMFVPNAVLGARLLGEPITRRFMIGSALALVGIALLLVNEARVAPLGGNVLLGTGFGIFAMLAASVTNVIQALPAGRRVPIVTLVAWAIFYGALMDTALALAFAGPPVFPAAPMFWLGTVYLAVIGTVVTLPLYYRLVRELGAGRAAYNGVLVVVIAMTLSTLLEGYRWTGLAIAGAVLAVAGLVVALRARQVAKDS